MRRVFKMSSLRSIYRRAMIKQDQEVDIPPKDDEEIRLEKLVFGDLEGFETNLKKVDNLYDFSSDEYESLDDDKDLANSSNESDDSDLEDVQDEELFFLDDEGRTSDQEDQMDVDESNSESDVDEGEEFSDAAWSDSDDDNLQISLLNSDKLKKLRKLETDSVLNGRAYISRLRAQFEKIYPRPEWADENEEEDDSKKSDANEEEESIHGARENDVNAIMRILAGTDNFVNTKQLKLISPNKISITRLKDANYQKISKGAIQSLNFHHSHSLLLTGGFDRTLRIYHIDGKVNNFITSLHLRDLPISRCQFSTSRSSENKNFLFAGGRRRYMVKWDLNSGDVEKISRMYGHQDTQKSFENFKISPRGTFIGLTGNSGWCNILNGNSGQWVKGFKIEGTIVDFEFSRDETFIIVVNSSGEVWEFDLSQTQSTASKDTEKKNVPAKQHNHIIRRWHDDGGIGITKIKLGGPKDRWIAIGTNNGLVNIYDRNSWQTSTKPSSTIDNLVSSISSLEFSPDGQILCIASRAKRDALRLVHVSSGSVYSNWPTSGTPLGKVTAVAFSPNNEVLAVGNESGKVTLWRLNHY